MTSSLVFGDDAVKDIDRLQSLGRSCPDAVLGIALFPTVQSVRGRFDQRCQGDEQEATGQELRMHGRASRGKHLTNPPLS